MNSNLLNIESGFCDYELISTFVTAKVLAITSLLMFLSSNIDALLQNLKIYSSKMCGNADCEAL